MYTYQRSTTASRRALAAEQGVRYAHVSVPLVWVPEKNEMVDGVVSITPGHYIKGAPRTLNIGAGHAKGYKRALRIARRRIMRVLKQQGRPFTGKVSLTSLLQAAA